MLVDDGKGRGFKAAVSSLNKLEVCSVVRTVDLYCNQVDKESYSIVVSQTPTGAGDCFGYVKNTSDHDMIVSSVKLYAATDEFFTVKGGDAGTPVGGAAATPVNRKIGSGNAAEATVEVGNDITGLSGGDDVETVFVKGGEPSLKVRWMSGLILAKNQVMTFYVTNGAIAVRATVSIHFCDCAE